MTFRDIIVNAAADAKLCDRTQVLPATIWEAGKRLLLDRIAQYSNSNLLEFSRKSISFDYSKAKNAGIHSYACEGITLGTFTRNPKWILGQNYFDDSTALPEATEALVGAICWEPSDSLVLWTVHQVDVSSFAWRKQAYRSLKELNAQVDLFDDYADIQLPVAPNSITRLYKGHEEGHFVSYEDYLGYDSSTGDIWTSVVRSDSIVELICSCTGDVTIFYNEPFTVTDFDKETRLPSQWTALITAALVVDFARAFPRLSDNTYSMLKGRLDELEHNIRRSSSVSKFLSRPAEDSSLRTYTAGLMGNFLR